MSQLSTFYPAPITAADLGLGPASNATFGSVTTGAGTFTTLSANNGTLTASAPVLDLSQTWNDSGTAFTAIKLDITNTASNMAGSKILDISVGGTGNVLNIYRSTNAVFQAPMFEFGSSGVSSRLRVRTGGGVGLNYDNIFCVGPRLEWQVISSASTTAGDVGISREAADTLGMARGTNAQTFNIYNTFTDSSNYERGFMRWSSNVLQIGTEKAGTGSARALEFQTDGTTRITIDTSGQFGVGVAPERPFHIRGSSAFMRLDRQGTFGPAMLFTRMASGVTVTSSWLFGPTDQVAGVSNDDFAIIDFGTAVSGAGGTQRLTISKSTGQLTVNGNLNLSTKDLVTDTTTGTKIGTGATQKLGFFNATPIVRPAAIADATDAATTQARLNDLLAAMRSLGLIAT